jgi:hypothetical protein
MTRVISIDTMREERRKGTFNTNVAFVVNGEVLAVAKNIVNGEMDTLEFTKPVGEMLTSGSLEQFKDLMKKVVLDVELGREEVPVLEKWMFIVIFFFTLTIFSILPLTMAYGVAVDTKIDELELNEIINLFSTFGVMILFCCLFFVWLLKELAKIISANIARYLGETFLIIEENENLTKKWFIYHPREKDSFLIGDAALPEDAKKFKIISRTSLLEQEIHSHRIRSLR